MNLNWQTHQPYTQTTVSNFAPEKAGVYILWVQLMSNSWKCFYVGQADNLKKRLLEHLSSNEDNPCIKNKVSKFVCGFSFALVPRQDDRDEIEKYLYEHYKPECNRISPPDVKPIIVNLP